MVVCNYHTSTRICSVGHWRHGTIIG
jgi:hypothetical protein